MIDHINAFVLVVRDVENCALFYRDKLAFDLRQLERDEAYLRRGSEGGIVLAIKSVELAAREISEARMRPAQESFERNHFVVFVTDIDAEYRDLLGKGVHFVDSPNSQGDGWSTAHFEDPEGNLWEIAQRPKR